MERILALALAAATAGWTLMGCCDDKACEPDEAAGTGVAAAAESEVAPAAAPEAAAPAVEPAAEEPAPVEEIDIDDVVFPEPEEVESAEPVALPTDGLPDVVATVDGKEITKATVEKMMDVICKQMQANIPASQLQAVLPRMREQVIRELIDRQILLNAAADTAFTDAEFEAELAEMKEELPPGVTFEELLDKTGMDMGEVREQMRIRKMLLAKAEEAAPATDEECRAFFEENKDGMAQEASVEASHILVSVPRDADDAAREAARAKIDDLKAQLDAGADFAELAKANSDCPSKANGGSLGRFGRGMMVPEFEDAAFSQEVGKVGDVVETTFGYHLVLVTKRSDAKEADYEDVKDRISELLTAQRQQETVRGFVEGLEAAAKVQRFDEALKEEEPELPFGLEIVDEDAETLAEDAEIVAEEAEVAAEEAAVLAEAAEALAVEAKAAAEKADEKVAEVSDAVAEAADDAVEGAADVAEEAKDASEAAVEAVNEAVEEAGEAASEVAEDAVAAASEAAEEASEVAEEASEAANEAVEEAAEAVDAAGAAVQDAAADAVEDVAEAASEVAEDAAQAAADAVEAVEESEAAEEASSVAEQAVEAAKEAADAVADAAAGALDAAKAALGTVAEPAADAAE
jgi:peptidyl-prolyl cis-trans isomerase C